VARSLLALKGLTYFDSGAVVAALTTSLPEDVGGERNWDYRYAWVRDASLAADAVYDAGLEEEAEHFFTWLSRVLADAVFPLRPLYDVTGGWVEGAEQHVPLAGWARSQPVRVGNAAADHRQMDFYADVAGVIHAKQFRRTGSGVHHVWDSMVRMADWLCDAWAEPDRGIWEVRSEPRHFISSKLSCAYALRRLADLAVARDPLDLRAPVWREEAGSILAWVADHGLAADGGLRQDDRTDDDADASLLVPVWRGLWPAGSPVAVRTVDRVLRELGDGPFVYRYRPGPHDGLPGREGAFLPCAFWAVKALAHLGRWDEAHERMEGLVSFGGPLGLLPEEADPRTRAFLGNLPQAYSHLALVEAALALEAGPT
jgi:GH15 family glucan-1,4-alpha-glucosidase